MSERCIKCGVSIKDEDIHETDLDKVDGEVGYVCKLCQKEDVELEADK